ncbi:hypothetical protein P0082_01515 [Candidatus Haliotispira prima]|uniref:Outer membrane protein beta-barrel domain-containing protein n=1 Tax=Candidatus Haliotispira prima TaxID=3034016 RepID=A0ABY8ML79_9SPIO|nr:hypothetical protein P0082_01515 [Candidatus Haliotispira prima]
MIWSQCFRKKPILAFGLASLLMVFGQAGLWAQSLGGGLMYSSYLPFTSLYNVLETKNTSIDFTSLSPNFQLEKGSVMHYAPGGAISSAYAVKGVLMSFDIGIMGGAGPDNIIPDFPIRPFISLGTSYKFLDTPILGLYGTVSLYFDFGYGVGENSYKFSHLLTLLRVGTGISLKILPKLEIFAQAQLGIGLQVEKISLESINGNEIYSGTYLMVPVALFPEMGLRIWL